MSYQLFNMNNVKESNTSIVKSVLKQLPYGTKNSIAQITGLSVATCNTLLNELEQRCEILETEYPHNSIGRPPKAYVYNEAYAYICCIIISSSISNEVKYNVTNLTGITIASNTIELDKIDIETVSQMILSLIADYPKIDIVCIGMPGVISSNSVIYSPLDGINIPQFAEKLRLSINVRIIFENDMNAIAYGLFCDNSIECINSLVSISYFLGSCPGAGAIINGNILKGSTYFAGEIKNLPFRDNLDWHSIEPTSSDLISYLAYTMTTVTSILNPEAIVLTGESISEEIFNSVLEKFQKTIPLEHTPKTQLISDPYTHYMNGLLTIGLNKFE